MSHDGVGLRAVMRSVAFLTAGVLAVPALAGCSCEGRGGQARSPGRTSRPPARDLIADGGTLRWAVDAVPETLNTFQADADAATTRVAAGRAAVDVPARRERAARSATPTTWSPPKVVETRAQAGRALQAQPAGRLERRPGDRRRRLRRPVARPVRQGHRVLDRPQRRLRPHREDRARRQRPGGPGHLQRSRTPTGSRCSRRCTRRTSWAPRTPSTTGPARKLKVTAGPFALQKRRPQGRGEVTPRPATRAGGAARPSSTEIVLRAVPRDKRAAALAAGKVDLAEIDPAEAAAHHARRPRQGQGQRGTARHGPGAALTPGKALRSWAIAHGSDEEAADEEIGAREKRGKAVAKYADEQAALRGFEVRKSLEPAYTQLALNGAEGPLADERVRRAVARALDREELARLVLRPLGLPAEPVGSHLALSGQPAYADNSGALGGQDTAEAQALLADAGWVPGGAGRRRRQKEEARRPGREEKKAEGEKAGAPAAPTEDDGTYIVGEDDKPAEADREKKTATRRTQSKKHRSQDGRAGRQARPGRQAVRPAGHLGRAGPRGAYAPKGTRRPGGRRGRRARQGRQAADAALRAARPGPAPSRCARSAERIARMLERVGIRTEISKVADESYFKDHIASGQYDLALYSWPASAFPATDARPIYAKPVPAADGSLNVEQNYTRVGTDQVDQLFDQAIASSTRASPAPWSARPTPASGPPPDRSPSTSAPSSRRPGRTSSTPAPSASRPRSTRTWAS